MTMGPIEQLQELLTVRDFRDFRTTCGFDLSEIPDAVADQTTATAAQLWLLRRKKDPDFSFDQALDMSMAELGAEMDRLVPGLSDALKAAKAEAVREAAKAAAAAAGVEWKDEEAEAADPLPQPPRPGLNGGGAAPSTTTTSHERSSSPISA